MSFNGKSSAALVCIYNCEIAFLFLILLFTHISTDEALMFPNSSWGLFPASMSTVSWQDTASIPPQELSLAEKCDFIKGHAVPVVNEETWWSGSCSQTKDNSEETEVSYFSVELSEFFLVMF